MAHEFVIMVNGRLNTYNRYEDIPEEFDHVIKFHPEMIPGPHTHDEHDELHQWNLKLQQLMERERASSRKNK